MDTIAQSAAAKVVQASQDDWEDAGEFDSSEHCSPASLAPALPFQRPCPEPASPPALEEDWDSDSEDAQQEPKHQNSPNDAASPEIRSDYAEGDVEQDDVVGDEEINEALAASNDNDNDEEDNPSDRDPNEHNASEFVDASASASQPVLPESPADPLTIHSPAKVVKPENETEYKSVEGPAGQPPAPPRRLLAWGASPLTAPFQCSRRLLACWPIARCAGFLSSKAFLLLLMSPLLGIQVYSMETKGQLLGAALQQLLAAHLLGARAPVVYYALTGGGLVFSLTLGAVACLNALATTHPEKRYAAKEPSTALLAAMVDILNLTTIIPFFAGTLHRLFVRVPALLATAQAAFFTCELCYLLFTLHTGYLLIHCLNNSDCRDAQAAGPWSVLRAALAQAWAVLSACLQCAAFRAFLNTAHRLHHDEDLLASVAAALSRQLPATALLPAWLPPPAGRAAFG